MRGRAGGRSWLELKPRTGRTHQIRVHCAALGCPLVGDGIYGDRDAAAGATLHLLARRIGVVFGQRSQLWRRIMTDAVGLPLTACEAEEVSAMGAAVLAMAHAGVHGDIAATSRAMAALGDVSEPDPTAHEVYQELAEVQGNLYPALEKAFDAQAAFSERHPA